MPEKSDKEKITYARPQNRHAHPKNHPYSPAAVPPHHDDPERDLSRKSYDLPVLACFMPLKAQPTVGN